MKNTIKTGSSLFKGYSGRDRDIILFGRGKITDEIKNSYKDYEIVNYIDLDDIQNMDNLRLFFFLTSYEISKKYGELDLEDDAHNLYLKLKQENPYILSDFINSLARPHMSKLTYWVLIGIHWYEHHSLDGLDFVDIITRSKEKRITNEETELIFSYITDPNTIKDYREDLRTTLAEMNKE